MSDNPVLAAIRERRSIRKYTDEPLDKDTVRAVLDAGRWAPSGLNNQPWRFLVVRRSDPRMAELAQCTKYKPVVLGAAALILVFLERERMYHAMKDHQSAGACIQNLLLAAHAKGLGAVWLGEIVNQSEQVCGVVGIPPEAYEFQAAVALGRPAQKGSSSRRELSELLLEPLN